LGLRPHFALSHFLLTQKDVPTGRWPDAKRRKNLERYMTLGMAVGGGYLRYSSKKALESSGSYIL